MYEQKPVLNRAGKKPRSTDISLASRPVATVSEDQSNGCWLGLLGRYKFFNAMGFGGINAGCIQDPSLQNRVCCECPNHLKPFLGECIANHPKIHIDSSQTFSISESTFQSATWILSISSSSHEFLTPSRRHWHEWPQCPKPGKTWRKIKES